MTEADVRSRVETALRAHGRDLKRFVQGQAHPSDVDDILQIAALRAVENANGLQDPDRVLPWLYRIHRNVVTDMGRRSASEQRLKEAFAAQPAEAQRDEDAICGCSVAQARQLKRQHASILDLVDIGDASLKEAARILGITVNAATVRLHRARAALKQRLLEHCGITTMRECIDCRCTSEGCC
ncbi:MAG: sigma-70 family RNA polymerase sigma factor [Pseudomonadota bacterium]